MKKILVNALSALQGGGQTYLINLLADFPEKDFEITVLTAQRNNDIFEKIPNIKLKCLGFWGRGVIRRTLWENFYLPLYLKKNHFSILFSPGGIVPLALFKNKSTKLVTVSQNMLPFLPEQIRNESQIKLKIKFIILFFVQSFSFKKSDLMIFLSNYAKTVITKKIHLKNDSVIVPHGLSELFWKTSESLISEDFALYVSSFYSYKCHLELVHAWALFRSANPDIKTKLLLAGDHFTSYGQQVKDLIQAKKLENVVTLLGPIAYTSIGKYMQSSRLNIFASTCENCPNILLEYLASGRPVLSSNIDPMPEFAGDAVIYFNPLSVEDTRQKLEEFFVSKKYDVDSLKEKSKAHSRTFNWSVTREKTWEAIRKV